MEWTPRLSSPPEIPQHDASYLCREKCKSGFSLILPSVVSRIPNNQQGYLVSQRHITSYTVGMMM